MSEAEYLAYVFGVATGWLGWPPSEAWASTVPEILLATESKIDFVQMTTPGIKKKPKKTKPVGMASFISTIASMEETKVYGKQ